MVEASVECMNNYYAYMRTIYPERYGLPIKEEPIQPQKKSKGRPRKIKKNNKSEKIIKQQQIKNHYEVEFKKIRLFVLKRDNYRCAQCGSTYKLNVHHIIERSQGGTNSLDNLETLCYECHKQKHKNEPIYNLMNVRA